MPLISIAFSALVPPPSSGRSLDEGAPEDEVLRFVAAARAGDPEGARGLYAAYVARIYRTIRPLCVDDAEAEDVVQETFVRALEALDRFRERDGARFIGWLATIAMNVARRHRRRGRRAQPAEPSRLVGLQDRRRIDDRDPGDAIDRVTLVTALLAAIETLPDRDREVVTLLYGAELDAAQVAGITGASHANVRKIAQRARAALKSEVERRTAPRRDGGGVDAREDMG